MLKSELQPEEALRSSQSSVPHNIMQSSTNTAGKSTSLKKGASQGSRDSFHLRLPRSEASKHSRKLVRSFPESPSDVPFEEKSLGISTCSTFLQRLSPVDTTDSYTQPDYSRSCFQLYVPTSAEFYTNPVYSSSSDQLLSVPESLTQGNRCRSSDQLHRPTNVYYTDSSTHLDHSRSSGQLDMSTSIADSVIDFLLKFDQSRLKVCLIKATNLPKEFHTGMHCEPFVVLHLEPNREETFKSRVVKGTRDPEFRQTFQFERMSLESIKLQTLVLRIYNHAFHNKAIGKVCLPISETQLSGSSMQMDITRTEEVLYT